MRPLAEVRRRLEPYQRRTDAAYAPPYDVAPRLAALEEAIAAGATVEIEYHAPGRPAPTEDGRLRRIDPLRLERRGRQGVDYLIGYCHLRKDERTFRVDRIARITRA